MSVIIKSGSTSDLADVDSNKNLKVALANTKTGGASVTPSTQPFVPVAGTDDDYNIRPFRTDMYGTMRTTSETLVWHDAFEGSNINAWWTQSLSTMTLNQATGVLTMNNGSSTSANVYAIITSKKQFLKIANQPINIRFRAKLNSLNSTHSICELGLGAPSTNTATINDGAFFRLTANGTFEAVISYNGTETVTTITGPDATNEYYNYSIIAYDDTIRFIIQDPNSALVSDTAVNLNLTTTPTLFSVSHLPSFARVYVDGTGGGTAQQLVIAAHDVELFDILANKPWSEQLAGVGRQANMNPTTQAQTPQFTSGSTPAGGTPSNTAALYTTLGGDFIFTMTAASNDVNLSVFAFQIPSPYTFYLTGIYMHNPVVSTGFNIATAAIVEFGIVQNCASANLSTGGGIRNGLGVFSAATNAGAGTIMNGQPISWKPTTPIACLPGTYFHICEKQILTGAVTAGAIRGVVIIDGYFE